MKDNLYRKRIGEKLESAYASDSLESVPEEDQVRNWIEMGNKLRNDRRRRKIRSITCAAVLVFGISLGATCVLDEPKAEASDSRGHTIQNGMTTIDLYKDEDDLPESIKETFLMFPEMPEGYEFVSAKVETSEVLKALTISYMNSNYDEIKVEELICTENQTLSNIVNSSYETKYLNDLEIYEIAYGDSEHKKTYAFLNENIFVKIKVLTRCEEELIYEMIKTAVGM